MELLAGGGSAASELVSDSPSAEGKCGSAAEKGRDGGEGLGILKCQRKDRALP